MKKNRLIWIFFLFGTRINAQMVDLPKTHEVHTPEIGIKPQLGYLMAHHSQMQYLIQGHIKAFELYAEKKTSGNKNWHHAYSLPTVGMALYIGDLGNRTEMGDAIALFPYIKYHLVRKQSFEFNLRCGAGFAYLTQTFDRISNNKNSAIAAPVNATLNLAFEPEWKSDHVDVGLGLSFIHFSNGSFKTPNLGFNIPSLAFSFGYKIRNDQMTFDKKRVLNQFVSRNYIEPGGFVGFKEIMPANGPKYFVGDLNVTFRRHYHFKSSLLVMADINYNTGYKKSYENWYKVTVPYSDAWRAGGGIGYGLCLDRFMTFIEYGVYFYDKLKYDGMFYHRIGTRYYASDNVVINLSLKTHFAKADVVEVGVGYKFSLTKKEDLQR